MQFLRALLLRYGLSNAKDEGPKHRFLLLLLWMLGRRSLYSALSNWLDSAKTGESGIVALTVNVHTVLVFRAWDVVGFRRRIRGLN